MFIPHIFYFFIELHLGRFQFGIILNNAAMNIHLYIYIIYILYVIYPCTKSYTFPEDIT